MLFSFIVSGLFSFEYFPLVLLLVSCVLLAFILLFVSFFSDYFQEYAKNDDQRFSAYECGFVAFEDARMRFDVRYYLIAILFLIFDIELIFLFPWTISFVFFLDGGF